MKSSILNYIRRRLAPQPTKIRSDIEVKCFTYEGIDAVKQALLEGENHGTADVPLKIRLIAPPSYVLTTLTQDKDVGIQRMTEAIEIIKRVITSYGYAKLTCVIYRSYRIISCLNICSRGSLDVKIAPKAITQREESELQAMLERLASDLDEEEEEEES